MYYPFVNGMETLPIPADDEQVYLANRRLFRELVDIVRVMYSDGRFFFSFMNAEVCRSHCSDDVLYFYPNEQISSFSFRYSPRLIE